jgi:hypothetical protein
LFLSSTGSLGGRVRTQRLHSAPLRASGNSGPLFHFPPASYITRNLLPVDCSACHLLSRWYLARLIRPWRWRRYVPPKRRLTFTRLHGVISQKVVSTSFFLSFYGSTSLVGLGHFFQFLIYTVSRTLWTGE